MAEVNRRCHNLIEEFHMRRKYQIHQKTIEIKPLTTNTKIQVTNPTSSVQISTDRIIFNSADEAIQFVRSFGPMLTKLELNGIHSNGVVMYQVGNAINKHCTNGLNEIKFNRLSGALFASWVNSFESVQSVTIINVRDSENIHLNQLFPMMNSLDVRMGHPQSDSTFLHHHFEHLIALKVSLGVIYNHDPVIKEILQLNPQIIRFHSENFLTASTARWLSENYPNLQSLGLASHPFEIYGFTEEPIHFAKVTEFALTLYNSNQDQPDTFPFTFDGLKSFAIFGQSLSHAWIEFIAKNQQLNTVAMPWTKLRYHQLKGLIEQLPALNEISNACDMDNDNVENIEIFRIMNEVNQVNVVKCTLSILHDLDVFVKNIPDTWTLVENRTDDQEITTLTLVRNLMD